MKLLDLTLPNLVANLSLDEALLEEAESNDGGEILRIWEAASPAVVVGRSSPIRAEVNLDFCQANEIDVLRRCSGGASVVIGPGILMYAVILDYRKRPQLRMLESAHRFVMTRIKKAVESLGVECEMNGTCDLTLAGRKFSGNALRCKRNWMLYHGTLICSFDIGLIESCLGSPKRQPEYRQNRSHADFVTELKVRQYELRSALRTAWQVESEIDAWPMERTRQLCTEKYLTDAWTFKV